MKWSALVLAVVVTGCTTEGTTTGISDTQFIETMVELRQAGLTAGPDTARFVELRDAILLEQGVTEAELRAYVELHSTDLAHMAEMWDSVGARLTLPAPEPVLERVREVPDSGAWRRDDPAASAEPDTSAPGAE